MPRHTQRKIYKNTSQNANGSAGPFSGLMLQMFVQTEHAQDLGDPCVGGSEENLITCFICVSTYLVGRVGSQHACLNMVLMRPRAWTEWPFGSPGVAQFKGQAEALTPLHHFTFHTALWEGVDDVR